ncbi:MAG: hypothetical protein L3K23_07700 [Thermoplasmata archaeon]|nr:hypothetical protein [Thermoplasmata archaeon]
MAAAAVAMFFDTGCGPCTFWARFTARVSRSALGVFPLSGPEADRQLSSLSTDDRYGAFHIVERGRTWTGPEAMPAWVGLVAGADARAFAEGCPPVNRALRAWYLRFWEYRQRHGCAAPGAGARAL